jgi:hypothetical protein
MAGDYGPPDLPSAEELFSPGPGPGPGELREDMRNLLGIGPRRVTYDGDRPDTRALAEELGLE